MTQTLAPPQTQSLLDDAILSRLWDFVIIGAGPAGAMAAYELAKSGAAVLLLDQAHFPREKVCGGCFSARAVQELENAGLGNLLEKSRTDFFDSFSLTSGGRSARVRIPRGTSLSRKEFDFALTQEACKQGAVFISGIKGVLTETYDDASVHVRVSQTDFDEKNIRARFVLTSDGLLGASLKHHPENKRQVEKDSLVGISALVKAEEFQLEEHNVSMVCHSGGYLGMVRCGKDQLQIAAAVNPDFLKSSGSPAHCAEKILQANHLEIPGGIHQADWKGVSRISQARIPVSGRRYFLLGDTSFFVEPFTGEGIYWALLQARTLAAFLRSRNFIWNENLAREWEKKHRTLMTRRRTLCRFTASLLRRPALCGILITLIHYTPWLIKPFIQEIHGRCHE